MRRLCEGQTVISILLLLEPKGELLWRRRPLPEQRNEFSHLSAKRTKVLAEKIGPKLWTEIYDALCGEIIRFEAALLPACAKLWPLKPQKCSWSIFLFSLNPLFRRS
jgi:hypothetical protein